MPLSVIKVLTNSIMKTAGDCLPTVSLAWYVSNEKFFDVLKPAISNLKIRGSIGKINNDRAVSAYMYMSRLQNLNEGIYFGNDMVQYTSLLETQQANPSATYEESTQMNLGCRLRNVF